MNYVVYWLDVPVISVSNHVCATSYTVVTKFGHNQICGTKQAGSAGETVVGGPKWPSDTATADESEQKCASECNDRSDCAYYMWFNDKGCRLQKSCEEAVDGYTHAVAYVCKKGLYIFYCLTIYLSFSC